MTRYLELANECTDPVAGDYLWIYDASAGATDKDRKVNINKFAILANAGTFTAAQIINGIQIGGTTAPALYQVAAGHDRFIPTTMSLANAATYSIAVGTLGFVYVYNTTAGTGGLFLLRGGVNSVLSVYASTGFSATYNTASSVNVAYNSGYVVQNNTGGTISLWIMAISS